MGQLFSKKNREVFSTPLGMNNPVTVQVLGICSEGSVASFQILLSDQGLLLSGYSEKYHPERTSDC